MDLYNGKNAGPRESENGVLGVTEVLNMGRENLPQLGSVLNMRASVEAVATTPSLSTRSIVPDADRTRVCVSVSIPFG